MAKNKIDSRRALRRTVDKLKEKLGCSFCEERTVCCLDFHHVLGKKVDHIANLLANHRRTLLLEELPKCVCVCANCHRKIHAGVITITEQDKTLLTKKLCDALSSLI